MTAIKVLKITTFVTFLTTNLAIDTAKAQPNSFPLMCRGGGGMTIQSDNRGGVKIKFQPAKAGFKDTPPTSPGQCAWLDRAFSPNEPTTLCDSGKNAAQYINRFVLPYEYQMLQGYNNGSGCIQVTGTGN